MYQDNPFVGSKVSLYKIFDHYLITIALTPSRQIVPNRSKEAILMSDFGDSNHFSSSFLTRLDKSKTNGMIYR